MKGERREGIWLEREGERDVVPVVSEDRALVKNYLLQQFNQFIGEVG